MNANIEFEEGLEVTNISQEEPLPEDVTPLVARLCIMMMIVVPVTKYILNWLGKLIF